jgi:hypothetical protein
MITTAQAILFPVKGHLVVVIIKLKTQPQSVDAIGCLAGLDNDHKW